jgi:hypothetical protein
MDLLYRLLHIQEQPTIEATSMLDVVTTLVQSYQRVEQNMDDPHILQDLLEQSTLIVNRIGHDERLKPIVVYPLTILKRRMSALYDFDYRVESMYDSIPPQAPSHARRRLPLGWSVSGVLDFVEVGPLKEPDVLCECNICMNTLMCCQFCTCSLMMCLACRRQVRRCPQCRSKL